MRINLKCNFCDKIISSDTASIVCIPCASKLVEPVPQADNTAQSAIALLSEIVKTVDVFGHYHITQKSIDCKRINAVIAQQQTA